MTPREQLRLAKRIAHKMTTKLPPNVDVDDLVQVGVMGLMEATNRFDDSQGATLETFVSKRIHGAMLDELRDADWVSRNHRRKRRAVAAAESGLEQRLGRRPTDSEVAAELMVSLPDYRAALLTTTYGMSHIEDLTAEGMDILDIISGDEPSPFERIEFDRLHHALTEAIEGLPEREAAIIRRLYEDAEPARDIAASLGITSARICQIRDQAINRLRARLKDWL
jgi:RNA polymerase sigma factor for flagellar operon FliA